MVLTEAKKAGFDKFSNMNCVKCYNKTVIAKNSKNSKGCACRQAGFAPIIILILLVLVGVGAYYFGTLKNKTASVVSTLTPVTSVQPSSSSVVKPTADPTANWKTYTSGQYGFSFKYPVDYKVEERVSGYYVITTKNESVPQAGVSIDARLLGPYSNLVDARKAISDSLTITESKKISGWEVFQGVGRDGILKGVEFRQGIISYKTGVIEAETLANTDYVNIFDQILSTFQFTK